MSSAAAVTLVGVAILVAALALYLATIATLLNKVTFTLGTVLIGVRAIENQTRPVGDVVTDIVDDVQAIQNALEGLLAKASRPSSAARARADQN